MLSIKELPVWEGTYTEPNQGNFKEFKLIFNEKINIFQQDNICKTFYEDNDYRFITRPPGSGEYSNKRGKRIIEIILNYIKNLNHKNILEIGAGSDFIIKGIDKKIKFETATLIDPSLKIKNNRKIRIINEYYPSSIINQEKFDLIYSINVLEHVNNPKDLLVNVRNNLRENGHIIFSFPDVENRLKIGDVGCLLHEHINYFTKTSALSFFEACGFEIIDLYSNNENGEIHVFCKKNTYIDNQNRNSIKDKKSEELSKDVSLMINKLNEIKENFLNFYSKGLKVGFHGACNALSNFLYLCDLNHLEDFYIFDSDKLKSDTYLPFSDKKILHCSNSLYKEMDILFIAATNFSKEITLEASKSIDKDKIFNLY